MMIVEHARSKASGRVFLAMNQPCVSEAKDMQPSTVMKNRKIPSGTLWMPHRMMSWLKMNIRGRMAVRISYRKP